MYFIDTMTESNLNMTVIEALSLKIQLPLAILTNGKQALHTSAEDINLLRGNQTVGIQNVNSDSSRKYEMMMFREFV